MKTKILSLFLAVDMLFSVLSVGATAESLTEVPEGYVGVYTKDDLSNMRNDLSANYILMNDIIFSEEDFEENGDFYNDGACWIPVGTDADNAFSGTFDGNNYAIKNLKINYTYNGTDNETHHVGLIGYNTGTIKNLRMANVVFFAEISSGVIYFGSISGYNTGYIDNCANNGCITAICSSLANCGGISGRNEGDIFNCINEIFVHVESKSSAYASGITARNKGHVANSYNKGYVSVSVDDFKENKNQYSYGYVGGIVSENFSGAVVEKCYNIGFLKTSVEAQSNSIAYSYAYAGGIVAYNSGSIIDCFNAGDILESFAYARGTGGASNIGAGNAFSYTGGICSYATSTIQVKSCYNVGDCTNSFISEIQKGENTTITQKEPGYSGGITCSGIKNVTDSYFLKDTAIEDDNSENIISCSSDEMKLQETFAGFDFENVWYMDTSSGYSYPQLQGMPVTTLPILITEYEETIHQGKTTKIEVSAIPSIAEGKVSYKSINENIATASADGVTTAVSAGETIIEVSCGIAKINFTVTVEGHSFAESDEGIVTSEATCKQEGAYAKVCLTCSETIDFIIKKLPHTEEIINGYPATCTKDGLSDGVKCSACDDILVDQIIIPTDGHSYNAVVTNPTCTEDGYTTYTCECGDSYVADYVDANGHDYASAVTTSATHLKEGAMTYTCHCGDSYTESIAKIEKHEHTAVVTAPTCTENGYTTYTCECGDSYVADYVDASEHDYVSDVTTPATHLTEGVMTYTCHCGDSYTESIAKIEKHNYNAVVTAPTCTEKGFTTYTCECGDSYVADYVDATGHKNTDDDKKCDSCEFVFETDKDNEADKDNGNNNNNEDNKDHEHKCLCACHSENSFISFFQRIIRFLRSLFGLNFCRQCKCDYV